MNNMTKVTGNMNKIYTTMENNMPQQDYVNIIKENEHHNDKMDMYNEMINDTLDNYNDCDGELDEDTQDVINQVMKEVNNKNNNINTN